MEAFAPRSLNPMSEEQLKAFLEAVRADAGLQEKLKAAKDVDAVVAIAKAAGYVISTDVLKKAQLEVSEEELEGVAGSFACTDTTCAPWNTCPNFSQMVTIAPCSDN